MNAVIFMSNCHVAKGETGKYRLLPIIMISTV